MVIKEISHKLPLLQQLLQQMPGAELAVVQTLASFLATSSDMRQDALCMTFERPLCTCDGLVCVGIRSNAPAKLCLDQVGPTHLHAEASFHLDSPSYRRHGCNRSIYAHADGWQIGHSQSFL